MGSMTQTIGQVELAKLANVSQKTVSRALQGEAGVSETTRERITELAARHHYRPNLAARSTRTGRFGVISLLLSTESRRSALPGDLLAGVHDGLIEHDMKLMVVRLPERQLADGQSVPRMLREACSDGLLVDYTRPFPALLNLIESNHVPAIWINQKRQTDAVYSNDYQAARQAVQQAVARGHRRIDYFHYRQVLPGAHYSEADRLQGYLDAMNDAGLSPRARVGPQQDDDRVWVHHWRRWLSESDRPTAVIGYADKSIVPVIRAADQMALTIPDDLSLVTFGFERSVMGMRTSAMMIPSIQIGRAACHALMQKIDQPHLAVQPIPIPFEFVDGQTLADASC